MIEFAIGFVIAFAATMVVVWMLGNDRMPPGAA